MSENLSKNDRFFVRIFFDFPDFCGDKFFIFISFLNFYFLFSFIFFNFFYFSAKIRVKKNCPNFGNFPRSMSENRHFPTTTEQTVFSLHFIPGLQSAFYTQSAICSLHFILTVRLIYVFLKKLVHRRE